MCGWYCVLYERSSVFGKCGLVGHDYIVYVYISIHMNMYILYIYIYINTYIVYYSIYIYVLQVHSGRYGYLIYSRLNNTFLRAFLRKRCAEAPNIVWTPLLSNEQKAGEKWRFPKSWGYPQSSMFKMIFNEAIQQIWVHTPELQSRLEHTAWSGDHHCVLPKERHSYLPSMSEGVMACALNRRGSLGLSQNEGQTQTSTV